MARRHRRVAPMTPIGSDAAIGKTEVSKQEFARRLHHYMVQKDWTQSDLARAAFGTRKNNKGYIVAKNREIISQLIGAKWFPSPLTLHRVAKALGVAEETLLPQIRHQAIEDESEPDFEFKVAQGRGDEGLLRINRIVRLDQFSRIVAILQEPDEQSAPSKKR